MVALGLALGASIAWGGSDFLAGLVTRRLPVLTVLVLSQAAGLVLLLVLLALAGQPAPPPEAVLIAAGGGLAEIAGFSALAFGAFFVGTNAASDAGGVAWTVAVNRSTSFAALALVVAIGRRGLTYRSADLRPAAVVSLLDAGANALFALALTRGMTSTVGVIGSLYPVTTVLLAAVVLRERPRPLQGLGVAGVLIGVGLVIAWGGA
jgi:drug/metabolite transporter (DMT)-like permease